MKNIKFDKTECGVDFLINILFSKQLNENYFYKEPYITDYFEIVFIKKGNGLLILNQFEIPLSDNMVVFISANQRRQWQANYQDLELTVLIFQDNFLNDFFSDHLFTYKMLYFYQYDIAPKLYLEPASFDQFIEKFVEIKSELKDVRPDSAHIIRAIIYYTLQRLNRLYAKDHQLSLQKVDNNCAFIFKQLLETHIKEKQRVNEYAELLNISRIALNNNCKLHFNTTATDLIKNRLINEIKNMILFEGKSISEISTELNFSEPNHMMRFFKTNTGVTLKEFVSLYQ
jgi:AraC family transcriptional regulator, transcriptional activator of pobA